MKKILIAACALVAIPAVAVLAAEPAKKADEKATASAEMKNTEGKKVGEVKLTQAPNGLVAQIKVWDLPEGDHAFHIHEVGKCEAPFKTAGSHHNPTGHQHGIQNPKGQHAGDLPNLKIGKDGKQELTVFLEQVSLTGKNKLLDQDGSSFVVHTGPDDYMSDPAGNAGDRIACGVVRK